MSKILFLHGLQSQPGGKKPRHLKQHGFEVFNPHLPKSSWEESIKNAQEIIDIDNPHIVIGSSRGGAIAMLLDLKGAKLILIAPAWKRFGAPATIPGNSIILHSPTDNVIPYGDSEDLQTQCGVTLVSCGTGHRMNDNDALAALLDAAKWCTRP